MYDQENTGAEEDMYDQESTVAEEDTDDHENMDEQECAVAEPAEDEPEPEAGDPPNARAPGAAELVRLMAFFAPPATGRGRKRPWVARPMV